MRFVFLIGMLAALSGCASYRDVSFIYYPQRAAPGELSRGRPSFTPWPNRNARNTE